MHSSEYACILCHVMRTTIAIDEALMDELMRAEKDVSRSEAVRRAIKEHVWRKRADEFMKLAGSHIVDLDWRETRRQATEEVEQMEDIAPLAGTGHGRKH